MFKEYWCIHRRRFTPGKAGGKQQQIAGQLFAAPLQDHRVYRAVIAADKPFDLRLIAPDIRAEDSLRLLVRMVAFFCLLRARLADQLRDGPAALPQRNGNAV